MIFLQAEPNELNPRFVSKEGRWEVGISRMIFGFRVRLGIVGSMFFNLDYCAGDVPEDREHLLRLVMLILLHTPEECTEGQLEALFPPCERKPILLDPCWEELQRRAELSLFMRAGGV